MTCVLCFLVFGFNWHLGPPKLPVHLRTTGQPGEILDQGVFPCKTPPKWARKMDLLNSLNNVRVQRHARHLCRLRRRRLPFAVDSCFQFTFETNLVSLENNFVQLRAVLTVSHILRYVHLCHLFMALLGNWKHKTWRQYRKDSFYFIFKAAKSRPSTMEIQPDSASLRGAGLPAGEVTVDPLVKLRQPVARGYISATVLEGCIPREAKRPL